MKDVYVEAIPLFVKLIDKYPQDWKYHYKLGRSYINSKKQENYVLGENTVIAEGTSRELLKSSKAKKHLTEINNVVV